MTKHKIKVTQVFRVERETVIEVEAANPEDAADMVLEGDVDLPRQDEPVWTYQWKLQNEEADPA